MACEFDGGVVIGADSRSTTGYVNYFINNIFFNEFYIISILFRAYVANRVADKLTKVTDYIYCCRSGSSADTQAISDIVNYHLGFHR